MLVKEAPNELLNRLFPAEEELKSITQSIPVANENLIEWLGRQTCSPCIQLMSDHFLLWRPSICTPQSIHPTPTVAILFENARSLFFTKSPTTGGTRTRNPRLTHSHFSLLWSVSTRRPMPYPLGHGGSHSRLKDSPNSTYHYKCANTATFHLKINLMHTKTIAASLTLFLLLMLLLLLLLLLLLFL